MAKIPEALAAEVEELLNDVPGGVIPDATQEQLLKAILKTQIHTNYLLAMIACLYMYEVAGEEAKTSELQEQVLPEKM